MLATKMYMEDQNKSLTNNYNLTEFTKIYRYDAKEEKGDYYIEIRIVDMFLLKSHEKTDTQRLADLKAEIESDGILKKPIVVDVNTNVVLDGHHRIDALKALGCSKIPVVFVDYQSPKIGVKTAENGEEYPKRKVIDAALRGEPLPPKSTWHYIIFSKEIAHISRIQKPVNIPLGNLK